MTASTYKTILVHQDSLPRSPARLDIAIGLAERMGAHIVGIHPAEALSIPGFAAAEIGTNAIGEMQRHAQQRERDTKARFEDRLRRAGGLSFEWIASADASADAVTRLAHYADLTILGKRDPENVPVGQPGDFLETAVLQSGGPTLVVPHSGTYTAIGGMAVVAWNRSRESARAIKDSLPLLKLAREVTVITTRAAPSHEIPSLPSGTEVARFLSRHGIKAEAVEHRGIDIDRGEWLLSRTADLSAQLVVMGAYGHSRLRELVLGGVTRTFLQSMTVPVLMSH
jgi:nucleotide-binding universal stress UspA family protein